MELIKDGIERKRKEKEQLLRFGKQMVKIHLLNHVPKSSLKKKLMTTTIISGVKKRG